MRNTITLILAAGKGTRMKSSLVKVLHPLAGIPMLRYPVRAARRAGSKRIIIVVGHQHEQVKTALQTEGVEFALQQQQLGSGHAVAVAEPLLAGFKGSVLILCGDVPLITARTIRQFRSAHSRSGAVASVLTVNLQNPFGYGRIVRDATGQMTGIVEERDADGSQKKIKEINTGIYCCSAPFLLTALKQIKSDNTQGEYYLPDIISIAVQSGKKVLARETREVREVMGINDRQGLAEAEQEMRHRIVTAHMKNGVTFIDPATASIGPDVRIGRDTTVSPNTILGGKTSIGSGCIIDANSVINNAVLGNNVHIRPACVIDESRIRDNAVVGPFAHLRSGTNVGKTARIGSFVEAKNSRLGPQATANHLSYLGDTVVGKQVTIGAGTVTCNFDGKQKHATIIEDGALVGSNTSLIAPVKIGRNAVTGAGSAITRDVPENATGIARGKQVNLDKARDPFDDH